MPGQSSAIILTIGSEPDRCTGAVARARLELIVGFGARSHSSRDGNGTNHRESNGMWFSTDRQYALCAPHASEFVIVGSRDGR